MDPLDDDTTPVLVGYGSVHQRLAAHQGALDAAGLMIEAARATLPPELADPVLAEVDWVGATQGLTHYPDPARLVADAVGAPGAHTVLARIGVMQQTLVSQACRRVQSGSATLALVVGGEARYRDVVALAAGEEVGPRPQPADIEPDEVLVPTEDLALPCEREAGAGGAPAFYALLESGRRARLGQTPEENRRALGELYARFSEIAAGNPDAVRREVRTAHEIAGPSAENPYVAAPYTKLMVTTWTVDQAAALLFCTVGTARRLGIPEDRWLYPVVAVEANHMGPVTARRRLTQPGAMRAMADASRRAAAVDPAEVDLLDLYSCFPVAVTTAAEGLDLPAGRDLTVTGGMSFAGGPLNNYVFQAMARAASLLAEGRGATALVSCVSGLYTKQGFTVLATTPPARPFSVQDVTAEVAELEPALPVDDAAAGPGTIVAATVLHQRGEPERAVAVVELAGGARTMAKCLAPEVMARFLVDEPVGLAVEVADGSFSLSA